MSEKLEMFNIENKVTKTIKINNTPIIASYQPTYVEPAETHESAHDSYDGWIDSVKVDGKKYAIKAAIVEYHALTCPKCGGQIHMHNGMGKCQFCDTELSATIRLVEV